MVARLEAEILPPPFHIKAGLAVLQQKIWGSLVNLSGEHFLLQFRRTNLNYILFCRSQNSETSHRFMKNKKPSK